MACISYLGFLSINNGMEFMFSIFWTFKKVLIVVILDRYIQVLSYCNCNLMFVLCLYALNVNIALIFC